MNLYKCTVRHRHGDRCVYPKIFWIEADWAIAAYIKAKELTRNLDEQVYDPEVELYIPPKSDYVCTTDQVIEEYGTLLYREIERETRYCRWRDDVKRRVL